LPSTQNQ